MGGFCPDDWHGTTEADLQQMSWGEDYWLYADSRHSFSPAYRAERKAEYAVHDAAIALAREWGAEFTKLPLDTQSALMRRAERHLANDRSLLTYSDGDE